MSDTIQDEPTTAPSDQEPSDQELLLLVHSLPYGDPRRDEASTALIARHAAIVRSCVHRYRGYPEPEELMQVGYVGLLKAINNFDPSFGGALAAYAQPCISGEIKRHFRDKRWQVRVKRSAQELVLELRTATAELTQQSQRTPTDAELASFLRVSLEDVHAARHADLGFSAWSIDAPVSEEPEAASLAELLGEEDPQMEHAVDMAALEAHWNELPRRQQQILLLRFYGNMTQADIGQRIGLSQMHVSRLLAEALGYLRQHVAPTKREAPDQP